jgi:BlaI family penicillinase repressor
MTKGRRVHLTRREEQIMDILFQRGEASVSDFEKHLPGAPTPGAVRRLLNILYGKGAIEYRHDGAKKIYRPAVKKDKAGTKALTHVVDTFFGGSAAGTLSALLSDRKLELSSEEKKTLANLLQKAKDKGK